MRIAVWAHPYSEFPVGRDTAANIRDFFARLAEVGVESYFPFVLTHGKWYFRSEALGAPERDLLGLCLEAGREAGVQVHPILGLGAVGARSSEGPAGLYDPGASGDDVPSWARNWPCPAWEENLEFIWRVLDGLLRDYAPDGIHLDYMRYPNAEAFLDAHPCVCERCRAARKQWLGHETISEEDWARPGVRFKEIEMRGRFVRRLLAGIVERVHGNGLALSLAARARYLKDAVCEGQDWVAWCHEGLLDFVCPMSYNPCFERFQRFVDDHQRLLAGCDVPLLVGIGRKSSLGENTPEQMERQIEFARERGAGGVCIFHVGAFGTEDYEVLRRVAEGD